MSSNDSLGSTDLDTGFKHLFTIYNAFDEGATNDISEHLTDDVDRNTAVTSHSNLIRNAKPRKRAKTTKASGNTTTEHTTAPSNTTTTHSVKHITLTNAPIELPFDTTTKGVKTTTKREYHNVTSTTEAVTEITIIVTDEDYYDDGGNVTRTDNETTTTDENTKSHLKSTTPASKTTVLHVDLYLTSTVPTTENGTIQSDEFGELQTINLENVNDTEEVSTIIRLDEDLAGDVTMETSSTTDEPSWALPKYTEDNLESELIDAKLLFATLTPQMVVVTTINENDNIFILKSNYTVIENELNKKSKTLITLPPVTETDRYLETLYEPTVTLPKLHKTRKTKTKKPHEKFLINETMPLLFSSKTSSTTKSGFLNKILQRTTSKAPNRNASEFPLLSATEELGMGNKSLLLLDQEDLNYQTTENRQKTSPTTDTTSDNSNDDLINRQVVLTTANSVSTEPWDYDEPNIPKNGAFFSDDNVNEVDFSFLHTKSSRKEITEPNLFLDFVLHDFTTEISLNPAEPTPQKISESSFTTPKSKRNELPKTDAVQSKAAALRRTPDDKIQNDEEPSDYSFMYDEGTVEDTFKTTPICNETGTVAVPVSTEQDDASFLHTTKNNSEITEENIFLNLVLHDLTTKKPNLNLDFIHDETTPNTVEPEIQHFEVPSSEISATDFSFLHTTKNLSEMTEENLFLNLVLHDLTTESVKPILEETENPIFHLDENVENLKSIVTTSPDVHGDLKEHLEKIIETKLLLNLLSHNLHNKAGYPIQDLIQNEKLKHLMEKVLHKNENFLDTVPNSNDFSSLDLKNEIRREKADLKRYLSKRKKKRTKDFLGFRREPTEANVDPIELLFPILKFVKKSNKINSTLSDATTTSTTPVTTVNVSIGSHNHTEITHTEIDKSTISSGKNTTLSGGFLNTTHDNEEITEKNLFFKAILHNSTEESVNYTNTMSILKELNASTVSSINDTTFDTIFSFLNTTHADEKITEKNWFFKSILNNTTEESVNYTNTMPILKELNMSTVLSGNDTTFDNIFSFLNTTHADEKMTEKNWFFNAIFHNSTEESTSYTNAIPISNEDNTSSVSSVNDTTLDNIFSFFNTTHGNEEITEENLFFKAILHNSTEDSVENAKTKQAQSNFGEKEIGQIANFTFDTPLDLGFLNTTHSDEEITEESIFLNLVLHDLTTKTDDSMMTDDYELDDTTTSSENLTVVCQTTQEPQTQCPETDTESCQKATTSTIEKSKKKKSKWRSMLRHLKHTLNNLFTESSILGLGVQKKETALKDIPQELNALLQKLKDSEQYILDDDSVQQNDESNVVQTEPTKYEEEREVSKNSIKEITPSTTSHGQDKAVGLIDNTFQHSHNFSTPKNTQNDSDSHKELDFSFLDAKKNHSEMTEQNLFLNLVLHDMTSTTVSPQITLETPKIQADFNFDQFILQTLKNQTDCKGSSSTTPPVTNYGQNALSWKDKNGLSSEKAFSYEEVGPEEGVGISDQDLLQELKYKGRLSTATKEKSNTTPCSSRKSMQITVPGNKQSDLKVLFFKNQENAKTERAAAITPRSKENADYFDDFSSAYFTTEESILNLDGILSDDKNSLKKRVDVVNVTNTTTTFTITTPRLLLDTVIPTSTEDSFLNLENSNDVNSDNSCNTTSGSELPNSDAGTKIDFKAHANNTKLKGLEGAIDLFFATESDNATGISSTKTSGEQLSSDDDNVIADFENMMLITFPPDEGIMGFGKLPLRTQCDNTITNLEMNLGSESTETTESISSTSSTTLKATSLKYSTNTPEVTTIGTRKTIPPITFKPIENQRNEILETTVADRTSRVPSIADLFLYRGGDEDYEQMTTQRKSTHSVTLENEDDEEVSLGTTQNSAFDILSEFIKNVRVPKEVTNFTEDTKRSTGTESTIAQCIPCGEEYTAGEDLDDEHSITWMTTRYVPKFNGTTLKNPSTPSLSGKTKKFVQNVVIKTNSTDEINNANATKLVNLISLSLANQSLTEGPNAPTNVNIIENVFYVQVATTEAPAFKTDTQTTLEVAEPSLLTLPTESSAPPKCVEPKSQVCTKPSKTTDTTSIYSKFYTSLPAEDEDMGDKIVLHNEAIASSTTTTMDKALTGIVLPTSYSLWNVDDFKDITEPTTIKTTVNTEIVEATLPRSTKSKPTLTTTTKGTIKTSQIPETIPTTSPTTSKTTEPTITTEKETPTATSTTLKTTAAVPITLETTTTSATELSTTYETTTGFEYFSTLTEALLTSSGTSKPFAETTPVDENDEQLTNSTTTPEEKTTTSIKKPTETSTSPEVSTETTQVPSSTAYETTTSTTESTTFLEQTTKILESTETSVTETTFTALTETQTTETVPSSTDLTSSTVLTSTELETTTFQEQTSTPIQSVTSTQETPSTITPTEAETTTKEQTTEIVLISTDLTSPTVLTTTELQTVPSSEETSSATTSSEPETTTKEQTTETVSISTDLTSSTVLTSTELETVSSSEETSTTAATSTEAETTTKEQTTETAPISTVLTSTELETFPTEETTSSIGSTELETSTEKQTTETLPSSTMSIATTATTTRTTSEETSSVTTETSSVASSDLTTEEQTTETSTSTSIKTTTSITTTTTSRTTKKTTQQQTKPLSTSTFSSSVKTKTSSTARPKSVTTVATTTHKTTSPSTKESTTVRKPLLVIKETTVSHLGKISMALTTEASFAKTTVTDKFREIISQMSKESTCNLTDYINRSSCVCSIDNLVVDLREKLKDSDSIDFENYYCPVLKHIDNGITFENNSVPHVIRFVNPAEFQRTKRDVIQNYNIEKVLNEPLELRNKGHDVYAIPGMSMQIPCVHYPEIVETIVNYTWTFADKLLLTEGRVQDHKGILTVDNITPQDAGNYTCFVITSKDQEEANIKYEHYVNIVSLPTYSLVTRILYNSTQQCQTEDTEIISLYFPSSLGVYICGSYFKVCKINVTEPQCVSKMYNYISLNVSVIIEPFNVIVPGINTSVCDVNCEMAAYSKIVSFVLKNLETIENMPVFINLSYRQEILFPTNEAYNQTEIMSTSEPPKLIIGCPPGFGYYSKSHLCGACKRNTYSKGDETKCQPCPAGRFQPLAGSQSCLICANPLQDPYCLRIVYSNTQRFRLLVGATMIIIIALSILIIWCQCFKKSDAEQSQKNGVKKRKRSKISDIEKQEAQPLLAKEKKRRDAVVSPPEPPPPDF